MRQKLYKATRRPGRDQRRGGRRGAFSSLAGQTRSWREQTMGKKQQENDWTARKQQFCSRARGRVGLRWWLFPVISALLLLSVLIGSDKSP